MQNAWIAIVGSLFMLTAVACGQPTSVEGSGVHTTSQSVEETEPSELGYGWSHEIEASEENGLNADYTLAEIITNPKVKVRADSKSCATCHSWAKNQDRVSMCKRVNSFLKQPTAKGASSDSLGAKPANLKKLLRDWKVAGCPE